MEGAAATWMLSFLALACTLVPSTNGLALAIFVQAPLYPTVPTDANPFVFIHTAKTGGSTLREIISSGAAANGIPTNKQYIPCHHGLECSTFSLPHKNYSIIAGHFSWRELQRVGLRDFDCIVSVRRPVDRVMSCLSYFYPREVMESVQGMSRHEFGRLLTEQTSCNNAMTRMLTPFMEGIDDIDNSINKNMLNTTLSKQITQAAVDNMRKCVAVGLFDDEHDKGRQSAGGTSAILARFFPWMHPPQKLPKLRQRRLAYYKFQASHLRQIEQLNALDASIYKAALKQMQEQQLVEV